MAEVSDALDAQLESRGGLPIGGIPNTLELGAEALAERGAGGTSVVNVLDGAYRDRRERRG